MGQVNIHDLVGQEVKIERAVNFMDDGRSLEDALIIVRTESGQLILICADTWDYGETSGVVVEDVTKKLQPESQASLDLCQ